MYFRARACVFTVIAAWLSGLRLGGRRRVMFGSLSGAAPAKCRWSALACSTCSQRYQVMRHACIMIRTSPNTVRTRTGRRATHRTTTPHPRGGRGGSALVRGPSSRRAAVESSGRTRPCSAWKTLRLRRYDLPPLRTGRAPQRAPLDARIALRAHLIPDGSHTTSSQRPKFTPRFSCPLSVRASSSA